jgi:hypothetical protein
MLMQFKYGYLNDGTEVKITEELFTQLKYWENNGIYVDDDFKDILKVQDDAWINSQRNFYEKLYKKGKKDGHTLLSVLLGKEDNKELHSDDKVLALLDTRTEKQKARFIKRYFLEMTPKDIAKEEHISVQVITRSLKKTRLFLMDNLNL